jgi:hypothetical protein
MSRSHDLGVAVAQPVRQVYKLGEPMRTILARQNGSLAQMGRHCSFYLFVGDELRWKRWRWWEGLRRWLRHLGSQFSFLRRWFHAVLPQGDMAIHSVAHGREMAGTSRRP